jgi:hypothetical protein
MANIDKEIEYSVQLLQLKFSIYAFLVKFGMDAQVAKALTIKINDDISNKFYTEQTRLRL